MSYAGEELHCSFTEPFIEYTWDSNTKRVTRIDVGQDYDETTGIFIPKDLGPAQFECSVENNRSCQLTLVESQQPLVSLVLDYAGSDGMSEVIYPFSATIKISDDLLLMGGCFTTTFGVIDPSEIIEKLVAKADQRQEPSPKDFKAIYEALDVEEMDANQGRLGANRISKSIGGFICAKSNIVAPPFTEEFHCNDDVSAAAMIYEVLNVKERRISSNEKGAEVFEKSVGGLTCPETEYTHPAAKPVYSCELN